MAARAGFSCGTFLIGALAMILLFIAIAAAVIFGGLYPVAASKADPPLIGWALHETMEQGVKGSAKGLSPPQLSASDIREGGGHYKAMCQECHGGPGAKPEEFATAINPRAPDLAKESGEWSVAQIFWIAKNGIKMSAMPAFGKVDEDEELWKIAAFVKQLPNVGAADYAALPKAHGEKGEEEGDKAGHSH